MTASSTRRKNVNRFTAVAVAFTLTCLGAARADENIGTTQQGLVGGQTVSSDIQEQFGLLTLSNPEGSCSASMLNDYWAITAAHCVYSPTTGQAFTAAQITLSANWPRNHKS